MSGREAATIGSLCGAGLLTVLLSACASDALPPPDPAFPIPTARSISEILRNVRIATDRGWLFQHATYTDAHLKTLFGGKEVIYAFVADGKSSAFARYYVLDFSGLQTLTESPKASIPPMRASASFVPENGLERGAIQRATLFLALNVEFPDEKLDIEHVRKILGAPLVEDKNMEAGEFQAATGELFNRDSNAADQGQIFTSDEKSAGVERKLVLHFGVKGSLAAMELSESKFP